MVFLSTAVESFWVREVFAMDRRVVESRLAESDQRFRGIISSDAAG